MDKMKVDEGEEEEETKTQDFLFSLLNINFVL